MKSTNRNNFQIANPEDLIFNQVKVHLRNSGIFKVGKHVIENAADGNLHALFGINIGWLFLHPVEGTDIVESEYMIGMFMGKQNAI